jgi:hypothetical protein
MALTMSQCTMVYGEPQYNYEEQYDNADYARLDDYSQVNWNDAQYDMQYTYYDNDRLFLVIYGNHIFVIPYDYFYHYIYPRFRMRIIWRSYDYFCSLWGWNYYNNLWNRWHYRHNRSYWRYHFNYYDYHKRCNNNRPFIIRKNEIQQRYNGIRYQINSKPKIFIPRNDRIKNYNYIPRAERHFIPKTDNSRNFNTLPSNSGVRHTTPLPPSPPPIIKEDKKDHKK